MLFFISFYIERFTEIVLQENISSNHDVSQFQSQSYHLNWFVQSTDSSEGVSQERFLIRHAVYKAKLELGQKSGYLPLRVANDQKEESLTLK